MIIEEKDFKMTSVDQAGLMFDLELLKTTESKDGTKNEKLVNSGYGMPFKECLKRIALNRASRSENPFSLINFVERFEEACKSLSKIKAK